MEESLTCPQPTPCPTAECGGQVPQWHEVCPSCEAVANEFKQNISSRVMWLLMQLTSLRSLFSLGRNFLGLYYEYQGGRRQFRDGYWSRCKTLGLKDGDESALFGGTIGIPEFCARFEKEPFDRIHILKWIINRASKTIPGQYPRLDYALEGYNHPREELLDRAYYFPLRKSQAPVENLGLVQFDSTEADVADVAKRSHIEVFKNALNKALTLFKLQKGVAPVHELWNQSLESGFAGWVRHDFWEHCKSKKGGIEYRFLACFRNMEKITDEMLVVPTAGDLASHLNSKPALG